MYRLKICSTENELKQFQQYYIKYSKLDVAFDYLQTSEVVALYRAKKMVGGYIFRVGPNLRYEELVADCGLEWPNYPTPEQCCELTCWWMATNSIIERLIICCDMVRRFQQKDVGYMVAGSCHAGLAREHRHTHPHSLIEVDPDKVDGWSFYYCEKSFFTYRLIAKEWVRRVVKKIKRMVLGSKKGR